MNCEQCREHLLEYAWGELPDATSKQIAAALEQCPQCQQELARIQETRGLWRQGMPDQELPALARANILRQARLQADTLQAQRRSPWTTLATWLMHPAVASVAALAVVIVIGLIFFRQDGGVLQAASPKFEEAATAAREESATAGDAKAAPTQAAPTQVAQRPTAQEEAEATAAEPAPFLLNEKKLALRDQKAQVQDEVLQRPAARVGRAAPKTARRALKEAPNDYARADDALPTVDRGLSSANTADSFEVADQERAAPPSPKEDKAAEGDVWGFEQQQAQARSAPRSRGLSAGSAAGSARAQANVQAKGESARTGSGPGEAGLGSLSGGGSTMKQRAAYGVDSMRNYEQGQLEGRAQEEADADAEAEPSAGDAQGLSEEMARQRLQEGMDRYNRADYAGAIEDFNAFMNEAPRSSNFHALALFHRGMSELRQGNASAAAGTLRKVITDHPDSEKRDEARYWLARALQKVNPEDAEARQILEQLSEGRGGMAGQARDQLQRSYGRQERRAAPAQRSKKKAAPKKSTIRPSESLDLEQNTLPSSGGSSYP